MYSTGCCALFFCLQCLTLFNISYQFPCFVFSLRGMRCILQLERYLSFPDRFITYAVSRMDIYIYIYIYIYRQCLCVHIFVQFLLPHFRFPRSLYTFLLRICKQLRPKHVVALINTQKTPCNEWVLDFT